jgi:hypothetical protein
MRGAIREERMKKWNREKVTERNEKKEEFFRSVGTL